MWTFVYWSTHPIGRAFNEENINIFNRITNEALDRKSPNLSVLDLPPSFWPSLHPSWIDPFFQFGSSTQKFKRTWNNPKPFSSPISWNPLCPDSALFYRPIVSLSSHCHLEPTVFVFAASFLFLDHLDLKSLAVFILGSLIRLILLETPFVLSPKRQGKSFFLLSSISETMTFYFNPLN